MRNRNMWTYILAGSLGLIGVGLLILTNSGIISPRKPYVFTASSELPPAHEVVAFVDVTVVPMDKERVVAHQTVIVRDGVIAEMDDTEAVTVPPEALAVEGDGRYLMPGLVDMHVHAKEENDLLLFVANGVTSVRDMWGTTGWKERAMGAPDQLALRRQIASGQLLGPTIYQAGTLMEGDPPTSPMMPVFRTPEEAEESIRWQAEQGYDFVKVYDNLDPATYHAILDTADEFGMPVVGHVPFAVGLDGVLDGGQVTIEHLSGYIDADAAAFIIPEAELSDYAVRTAEAGVYNVPTIGIYQKLVSPEELDSLESDPTMVYVSPRMRVLYRMFASQLRAGLTYEGEDYTGRINELFTTTTGVLHEHGALILLGTDCGNPYVTPGFSVHDELDYLVASGLTPFEALQAGTTTAAEALGESGEFGMVAESQRADLLLVNGNPLEDVGNAQQISGVMLRGAWVPEEQIEQMLDDLVASYQPTLLDRAWPLVFLVAAVASVVLKRWPG